MKIIVGGVISLSPYSPGIAWDWLQCFLGFQKLGHDVYYVEEVEPDWCFDDRGQKCHFENSANQGLFYKTMDRFGLMGRACQLYNRGEATFGLSLNSLIATAKEADVLINMSGHVKADFILSNIKQRVYVDQDPVYTQVWHAEYGEDLNFKAHNVFFSMGLNIGTSYTHIPDCGVHWHHILPPVVLEYWHAQNDTSCNNFTTIASWSGYSDLSYKGEWYRSKYEEFQRFAELPKRAHQQLEIALKSYREEDAGIQLLKDNGWLLSDASKIDDLSTYQNYIATSRAEIGIAQNAYVKGHSGWFSDRASHYLASGKPVLAQSTGFERHVPTGRGLLSFSTLEEAIEGIDAINNEYETHCRAAREFANEYLDYKKVLPHMLELSTP
jgi:hypothetical protein